MKTSHVLASMLFGSIAAAAPLQQRAYAKVTHTVVETVVVYTTIWDGEAPAAAEATSSPGLFFEQHHSSKAYNDDQPSSAVVIPTSAAPVPSSSAYVPPAPVTSAAPVVSSAAPAPVVSSVYTPPPVVSSAAAPTPEPSSVYTPAPAPVSSAAPAPVSSAAAPSPSAPSSGGDGEVHTGGSMTMNYFGGGLGSCGKPIQDTEMKVALAADLYGASTYDPATGNPTNKWCGAMVEIDYNGNTATAQIMDKCPGCTNGGFDMTPALWEKVTGGVGGASGDRLTGMTWKVIG